MDTASDNPLRRFTSFWLALALFLIFAILCLLLSSVLGGKREEVVDDAAASLRNQTLADVQAAQAAVLPVQVEAVFGATGNALVGAAPAPVKTDAHLVPNSPTWVAKQAEVAEVITIDQGDPDAPIDPAVMEAGKTAFALCMACHGPTGAGTPLVGPPLANSEWVQGPIENLLRIQLRGMTGPVTVNGVKYEFAAPMLALHFQTDEQIAAVLTYVRNSFGNKGTAVKPEHVKAFRGEVGKAPVTVEDLISPYETAEQPNDQ